MKGIRFIHTADFHLGSPLKAVGAISETLQNSLRESAYSAIRNIVDTAIKHEVDFVVICGDIYDHEARSVKGNLFFAEQMKRLAGKGIPVFMIYGNHDPIGRGTDFFKLPDNVRVLGTDQVELIEVFDRPGRAAVRVIGQSYATAAESRKIHLHYRPPADGLINIALLHTGLNPGARAYVPCSPDELKGQGSIHYWALGHLHAPALIRSSNPVIAYPGTPQGRDVGESGLRGCLLVEMASPDPARMQFIPTSPVIWTVRKLSLDSDRPPQDLDDLLDSMAREGQKMISLPPEFPAGFSAPDRDFRPEGYVVRWEIGGRGQIHDQLIAGREIEVAETLAAALNERLAPLKPFLWTEGVKLRTGSPIPALKLLLERDETVQALHTMKKRTLEEAEFRKRAVSAMGEIWTKAGLGGETGDDALPVKAEIFETLLEDAFNLAVERIVGEREDS